jgi:hypothetical protein
MGLESNPESKKLLEIGVKTIEDQIDCLNCDKKMKEHSKNGLIRCFYVVQSHAVKWGSELRERYSADQHKMAEMDEKQAKDIAEDQADRGDKHTVIGQAGGEEVRMMDNETEVSEDDPHVTKFLKDNPQWKTHESPLTEEQKKMADEMPSNDGLVGGKGMTQTIKDGKPTGNELPKKKKEKKDEKSG